MALAWIDTTPLANPVTQVQAFDPLSQNARQAATQQGAIVNGCVAMHVGQGDFTKIVDGNGRALLFFDCGGGSYVGSKSYPWHPDWNPQDTVDDHIDDQFSPLVILSHWDQDHWFSLKKSANKLPNLTFVAPRQKVSASHLTFIKGANTQVRFWPKNNVPLAEYAINDRYGVLIEKCSGPADGNPNYSGLALTLIRYTNPVDPTTYPIVYQTANNIQYGNYASLILLPGDAPYDYIPSLRVQTLRTSGLYTGMIAYHHGSNTGWAGASNFIPVRPQQYPGRCVYTYGIKPNNLACYSSVPGREAVNGLVQAHWTNRDNTSGLTAPGVYLRQDRTLSGQRGNPGNKNIDF